MTSARGRIRSRRRLSVLLALTVLLTACTSATHYQSLPSPSGPPTPPSTTRPNIVFVLTDDLSWNLIKYMPHVLGLQQRGMTFSNYTVTDSLCCPSRASILSGRFPHDTHILANTAPHGGFPLFHRDGEESNTYATSLFGAGYRTGFMGKYLNGYNPGKPPTRPAPTSPGAWVPPGWTTWNAVGDGYPEYGYGMAEGHDVKRYGSQPADYLTTVLQQRATDFLHSEPSKRPFALEVASFAPHYPYTPAPADLGTFPGIEQPQTPAFNALPHPAPQWLRGLPKLNARDLTFIQRWWQMRVESVQSIDRLVGSLERTIRDIGQAKNTVFIFSSDNGYHLGEYRLRSGKQTAFDTDIRVPLIVAGPGIKGGSVNQDMVENIDLRPTFDELAGTSTPANVDGHSLVPLLHGEQVPWRTYALVEHHYGIGSSNDPDRQNILHSPVPPTYNAIRSPARLYVRYVTGDREYYNLTKDPYELHNLGPSLSASKIADLDRVMNDLISCHGGASCWQAGSAPKVR